MKMNKKRGMFLVVLVLFLVVLGGAGYGLEEAVSIGELRAGINDCTNFIAGCNYKEEVILEGRALGQASCFVPPRNCGLGGGNCGCALRVDNENVFWCEEDHYCFNIVPETILTQNNQLGLFGIDRVYYDFDGEDNPADEAACISQYYVRSSDGAQYLCTSDGLWKRCNLEDVEKKVITWTGRDITRYEIAEWEDMGIPGQFYREEGFPSWTAAIRWYLSNEYPPYEGDYMYKCVKNDQTGLAEWQLVVTEEGEQIQDFDHDGYSTNMGDCDDNDLNRNPGTAEIYDNGIDDDCNPETPDSPADSEEGCESESIKGSWIKTSDGENQCCGDSDDDFGDIKTHQDLGTEYICLDTERIGSVGGVTGCSGWCWVGAAGDDKFKIFTLKKENQIYDVVANGEQWFECKESEGTKRISDDLEDLDLIRDANKFYCYQEGNRWSWAKCEESVDENDVKSRGPGDSLFKLPLSPEPDFAKLVDLTQYNNYYGEDSQLNFGDDDWLEFMVRFTEELTLPAGITLTIKRQGVAVDIKENVLGYATNNPLLNPEDSEENWIHVKIPLPEDLRGVETVKVESLQDNKIEVKNMFLSKRGEEAKICSGETIHRVGAENSAWYESLDVYRSPLFNGQKVCTELYGGNAWLGEEVEDPEAMCCGDEAGKYYVGPARNNLGCWNSEPVTPEQTITNLQFEVSYPNSGKWIRDLLNQGILEVNVRLKSGGLATASGNEVEVYTYACPQDQCLYPLPGFPPYTLTNPYQGLYDLYFVSQGEAGRINYELIITNTPFNKEGNILAKRVPQQVIHLNSDEEDLAGFFGCNAPGYLENIDENLNSCQAKSHYFCDYSGTWQPQQGAIRDYSRGAVPAQNILSNAEFVSDRRGGLEEWTILDANGATLSNNAENNKVNNKIVSLERGEKLISERIPIEEDLNLKISAQTSSNCGKIKIINREGKTTEAAKEGFLTPEDVSFIVVEFTGKCDVTKPMLQIIDDNKPAVSFFYNSNYRERAGAACCPETACWNGYQCVASMVGTSDLSEQVGAGEEHRDYRCLDGEWQYAERRPDWTGEKSGFCDSPDQCFVIGSSEPEAEPTTTTANLVEGTLPLCIEEGGYILDHYCEKGNWTSRTKFLVENLLTTTDENFVLYCANPEEATVNITTNDQPVILGTGSYYHQTPTGQEIKRICFSSFIYEGTRGMELISVEDNHCVNNICVLRGLTEEGKVVMGTTLNQPLNDPQKSFLLTLGVDYNAVSYVCAETESSEKVNGFIKCTHPGLLPTGDIWYHPEWNMIIYGKEGAELNELEENEGVLGWLSDLWNLLTGGTDLESVQPFLERVQNFKDVYLLHKGDKSIRAVKEVIGGEETLLIQLENFETDVCDYTSPEKQPLHVRSELLGVFTEGEALECRQEGDIQTITTTKGVNYFWPPLTGKLRVEDS